ncbi:YhcN/YlaJ family sporulation lipoprotein [Sporosarcina limicola]|uniref:YhcN/YlaJ family sporulation lipoprotein n=1 Tax=Sporosarcina limicola TaxID=34101 RepID=A0A927MM46_9BACL|nr:YhcN/YlaJ family sporulation lipoprotein [Sporosarcina limicola]MBE1554019.1 YhcN/YlaJ family sporulation lipoprotein [Sporosarcina limicola]
MKKIQMFTMIFLVAVLLMGCGMGAKKVDNATTTPETNVGTTTTPEVVDKSTVPNESNKSDLTTTNQSKLEVADEAATRITELKEVDSATVIVTDENAYVAAVLKDNKNEKVAKDLEDKIAEKVRSTNAVIKNVYVSVNPEFVKRMTEYGTKINEGKPVEGFFEEFSEAMRNVFPTAR